MRLFVFWLSGWRPVLRHYLPALSLPEGGQHEYLNKLHGDELLTEIKMAGKGKEQDGIRNYLRRNRTDAYILVPELAVTPTPTLLAKVREAAHIIRPVLYAIVMGATLVRPSSGGHRWRWAAWGATLSLDLFANWPQIHALLDKSVATKTTHNISAIEKDEQQIRLLKMLLYLLREPFYSGASKKYLDSVSAALFSWRLLRPFVGINHILSLFLPSISSP